MTPRKGPETRRRLSIRRVVGALGPGVITGAADDDPSGIATYSIAGAQLGYRLLWTALFTWPLMMAVQIMCARIGMVSGRGLSSALRKKFPRPLVVGASIALLAANTINIAADLAGMGDAIEVLTGVNSRLAMVALAAGITWATIRLPYEKIAGSLKWLAVSLFAYIVTAIYVHPDWSAIARATFIPSLPRGHDEWRTLVAILGTTISPYLFYWQASQEVEEEKAMGRRTTRERRGASADEILDRRLDIGIGTFFSNAVMFAIIVTTAVTLHAHGITTIESSRQAAEALRPLAGRAAAMLYTIGIVGVGLLAIPTLSGSAAYALAEIYGWRQGLDEKIRRARRFYGVILLSTAAALLIDFTDVNPVQALYWSAVINGVLAPLLIGGILLVAVDPKLMSGQPSPYGGRILVGIATLLMGAAVVLMFAL